MRDEKDTAISELNRLKVIYHDRVNELNDECNIKVAQLENQLLEGVMEAQREYKIGSTPSFIVNGVLYSGNKNIKEFRQIIDKILSQ